MRLQDVHDLVHEFMDSQIRANNQQVFFRLTWLLIRDDFLEEIGVDWANNGRADVLDGPYVGGYRASEARNGASLGGDQ